MSQGWVRQVTSTSMESYTVSPRKVITGTMSQQVGTPYNIGDDQYIVDYDGARVH